MFQLHYTTDDTMASDSQPIAVTTVDAGATPVPPTQATVADTHLISGDEEYVVDYEDVSASSGDDMESLSSDEEFEDVKNCIPVDEYYNHVSPCVVSDKPRICTICIEPMKVGDIQNRLGCGHGFHPECIKPWLTNDCTHPLCPNCRYDAREGVAEKPLAWLGNGLVDESIDEAWIIGEFERRALEKIRAMVRRLPPPPPGVEHW